LKYHDRFNWDLLAVISEITPPWIDTKD